MSLSVKIKKGLDLAIAGEIADRETRATVIPAEIAIFPDDFHGFEPKIEVKEGERVEAGQALLHDKRDERIKIVSPTSGTIKSVVRGERRHIERIVITPDSDCAGKATEKKTVDDLKATSSEEMKTTLMERGLWALLRQRPYDIVPEPDIDVRDIFVTSFDSAPLAVDVNDYTGEELKAGAIALKKLTSGQIYISRRASSPLPAVEETVDVIVEGPHPAGNVGVQAANIAPVNKGESIITLDITTLGRIGRTLLTGKFDSSAIVALTGPEVEKPGIIATVAGCDIKSLVTDRLKPTDKHLRIISGNVLTGIKVAADGYLHFPWRQITVIDEGDDVDEFMGWASLSPKKMSNSRTFISKLLGRRNFNPDARLLGGRRALIMSEQYDDMMPMDIMAEYLLKAIIGRDIEKMEELGIYEVAPEDFALGEWADASKIPAQQIVREGLDYIRKELR